MLIQQLASWLSGLCCALVIYLCLMAIMLTKALPIPSNSHPCQDAPICSTARRLQQSAPTRHPRFHFGASREQCDDGLLLKSQLRPFVIIPIVILRDDTDG